MRLLHGRIYVLSADAVSRSGTIPDGKPADPVLGCLLTVFGVVRSKHVLIWPHVGPLCVVGPATNLREAESRITKLRLLLAST